MASRLRVHPIFCAWLLAAPAAAAPPEASPAARSEIIVYRVAVGADGRVTSARPFDPAAPMADIGQGFASRLVFTPAQKDGRAAASTTCATLHISAEPKPDKTYGVRLLRAVNAPCLLDVGSALPPRVNRGENGGRIVLGANLLPDGRVDAGSITLESAELRVPQPGTQARYEDHARLTLRGSRFELDTVDGAPVTVHVSAPFEYGGGPGKRKPGEDRKRGAPPETPKLPSWNATSTVPGVQVPKIDYTAPAPSA
jgi:hypothetical protein